MRTFAGPTGVVHAHDLTADVRAYFSATAARLGEEVWLRVETRWIADGTPLSVTLHLEDAAGDSEVLKELEGNIRSDEWEYSFKVDVPRSKLDEKHGALRLQFEAAIEGQPLEYKSQQLLIHRTRFSS